MNNSDSNMNKLFKEHRGMKMHVTTDNRLFCLHEDDFLQIIGSTDLK